MLTLRIPKIVELANPKLTVLYRVSVVVIIVPFAVRSVVQREYDAKQPMSDSFGFSLNVRPLTVDQIRKVNKDWRSSEHCREPKRYNFVADSHRAYVNHSCVPICARSSSTWPVTRLAHNAPQKPPSVSVAVCGVAGLHGTPIHKAYH